MTKKSALQRVVSILLDMYDKAVYQCEKEHLYIMLYNKIRAMVAAEYPALKNECLQIGESLYEVWPGWGDPNRWHELIENEYSELLEVKA